MYWYCLTSTFSEPQWDQRVRKTGVQFTQVKLTKISCIETLFKVLFIQDSDLIGVQLR